MKIYLKGNSCRDIEDITSTIVEKVSRTKVMKWVKKGEIVETIGLIGGQITTAKSLEEQTGDSVEIDEMWYSRIKKQKVGYGLQPGKVTKLIFKCVTGSKGAMTRAKSIFTTNLPICHPEFISGSRMVNILTNLNFCELVVVCV
jgi:hypothetical protein